MNKNEQNLEFFLSADGIVHLYCRWIDYERREFFVINGEFFVINGSFTCILDENGRIFIPSIGETRARNEDKRCKVHYFDVPYINYDEKLRVAQHMLDNLAQERK